MSNPDRAWEQLTAHLKRIETLQGVQGLLEWDEQTMMPSGASSLRGEQKALLSTMIHGWLTDDRVAEWLDALESSSNPLHAASYRNLKRDHSRAKRLPSEWVERNALAQSEGFAAWLEAKPNAHFETVRPHLERLFDLAREKAALIDESRHPYDVLLEGFDPGTEIHSLRTMFGRLRDGLTPLLAAIADRPQWPRLDTSFDVAAQEELNRSISQALGYRYDRGRLDSAEHPFTSGFGPTDVRITTHLYPNDVLGGLSGTIHETGHGLYEQGIPTEWAGTWVGEAASYGLHESQSRFWENLVGRSEAFCRWLAGRLRERFGADAPDATTLYRANNRVERGLIRVYSDEVSYNLHIIVRFELESELVEGKLAVKDLPEAWNERYRKYLGVVPPDDGQGVLQDVHWPTGAIAYFPSYTLGNLYAASMGATLLAEKPNVFQEVEAGRFETVLAFLREKVHQRGHIAEAPEIVRDAVGERDYVEDLLEHLWNRHGALYGVERPSR